MEQAQVSLSGQSAQTEYERQANILHNACEFEALGELLQDIASKGGGLPLFGFATVSFLLANRVDRALPLSKALYEQAGSQDFKFATLYVLSLIVSGKLDLAKKIAGQVALAGKGPQWLCSLKDFTTEELKEQLAIQNIEAEIMEAGECMRGQHSEIEVISKCPECGTIGKLKQCSSLASPMYICHICYSPSLINSQGLRAKLANTLPGRDQQVLELAARVKVNRK